MTKTLFLVALLLPLALFAEGEATEQSTEVNFDSASQTMVLAQALKSYYSLEGVFSITSMGVLEPLAGLPDRVEIVQAPDRVSSSMMVRARFMDDAELVGEISGTFRAKLYQKALATKRNLRRGDTIAESDIIEKDVDVLSQRQALVPFDAKIADYEAATSILAGKVLSWSQLRSKPLVHKGDIVEVVASAGSLQITSKATALSDAGLNETVTLRNTSSMRQFQAKVINENLAEITF